VNGLLILLRKNNIKDSNHCFNDKWFLKKLSLEKWIEYMKKIIIVGAGVAGLSAGIYAFQSGFDVTIFEQHTIPGGNCTSWKRKGYFFEGGLHWLTGSSKKTPLYNAWKNVGALDDNTKVFLKDPFFTYYYCDKKICLYRDPDKLNKHLLEVSPEDEKAINSLCKDIKRFAKVNMPVQDIKGIKTVNKNKMPFSDLLSFLKIIPKMSSYNKISCFEYSQRFKHPAIRGLVNSVVGENLSALAIFFTLGCLASGDGGYLEGGSLKMAHNMAKRFTDLGGEIKYSSKVDKVLVENGKATGVVANGQVTIADAVIVTADTVNATIKLFDKPLHEPWMEKMRKNVKYFANTFVCIGVETDLSDLPQNMAFPLEKSVSVGGENSYTFEVNNYATFKGYAPDGCTALTVIFMGDTYEYWHKKKQSGEYEAEKEKIVNMVIKLLEQKIPKTAGKIAVTNVATPLTYERYCGTSHGSWMTLVEKGQKMITYPSKSENIKNLYFAGQRIQPPGGLPVALDTGRKAVQYLCKDTDTIFQGKM